MTDRSRTQAASDYRMRPYQIPALSMRAICHYPTYMRARPEDRTRITPALLALYPIAVPTTVVLTAVMYLYSYIAPWRTVLTVDARSAVTAKRIRCDEDGQPTWYAYDLWAYPMGAGRGRKLIQAAVENADRDGTVLTLKAANWELAERFYRPLGFDYHGDQRGARRPKMLRRPARATS